MAYKRKTKDEYQLHIDYGYGWECVTIDETLKEAKTLRIQRDKATLADDYKPEFIPGGFAAHCTNNSSQHYDYARNPEGVIKTAYWSESSGCFRVGGAMVVTPGRHEFYDYNF